MSLSIEEVFKLANERWNRKGSNDPIKESTMKSYRSAISKLKKELKITEDNFDWCFDCDKVISHINNSSRSDNSKKTIYSYLEIFLRGLSPDWQGLPELAKYKEEKHKIQMKITQTGIDNKEKCGMVLTNNQVKNLLDKKDIEVYVKTLKNRVKEISRKKDNFTNEDKKEYTIYLLLNTWLKIPVRNELWNLKFKRHNKFQVDKDLPNYSKQINWFIMTKDTAFIIRNVYKTADSKSSGGTKIFELDSDLLKIYKKYFKVMGINISARFKEEQSVFPYFDNFKEPSVEISRLISNAFYKETGKNVASTLLMKIIFQLSEDQNEALKYISWLSLMRGTSMDTLKTNYL